MVYFHITMYRLEAVPCRALQMLCSRFNLADELTVLLEGMRVQARQLDSVSARAVANEAIQDLASFVKTLADEMPQMAMAGTQAVVGC